jgi:hypothetical protein
MLFSLFFVFHFLGLPFFHAQTDLFKVLVHLAAAHRTHALGGEIVPLRRLPAPEASWGGEAVCDRLCRKV